jgi:hypothetical protein
MNDKVAASVYKTEINDRGGSLRRPHVTLLPAKVCINFAEKRQPLGRSAWGLKDAEFVLRFYCTLCSCRRENLRSYTLIKVYVIPQKSWRMSSFGVCMLASAKVLSLRSVSILKLEATRSSETSVLSRTTQCHILVDGMSHSHRRETLTSSSVTRHFKLHLYYS